MLQRLYADGNVQSKDYVINNAQLKADIITIDNALDHECAARLMQGKLYTNTTQYMHNKKSGYH